MSEESDTPNMEPGNSTSKSKVCSLRALKIEMEVRGVVLQNTWSELSGLIGRYQAEVEVALNNEKSKTERFNSSDGMDFLRSDLEAKSVLIEAKEKEVENLKEEMEMMKVELCSVQKGLSMRDEMLNKISEQMTRENKEWSDEVKKLRQYLQIEQQQKQALMQQFTEQRSRRRVNEDGQTEDQPMDETAQIMMDGMDGEGYAYVEPQAPEDTADNNFNYEISVNLDDESGNLRNLSSPQFRVDSNGTMYVNPDAPSTSNAQFSSRNGKEVKVKPPKSKSRRRGSSKMRLDSKGSPTPLEMENPILSSLISLGPAKGGPASALAAAGILNPNDSASSHMESMEKLLSLLPPDQTTEQNHKCEKCGQIFENKYGLVTHRWTNACSRIRSAIQNLSPDLIADTSSSTYDPERPFKCDRCDKTFKSVQGLQTHRKHFSCVKDGSATRMGWPEKTGKMINRLACKFCSATFKSKASLADHEKLHKTCNMKKCVECKKEFKDHASLLIHGKASGHDVSCHQCHLCEETFQGKEEFDLHIAMHQRNGDGKATFDCAYCLKSFSRESSMLSHQKIHMEVPMASIDLEVPIVPKQEILLSHQKIHREVPMASKDLEVPIVPIKEEISASVE